MEKKPANSAKSKAPKTAPKRTVGAAATTPRTSRSRNAQPTAKKTTTRGTASSATSGAEVDRYRRDVLKKGRNLIKPLAHNPRRVLKITLVIVVALIVSIASLFALMVYRYRSDSDFVYAAAQILPFPAARVNGQFVGYDDYLFELRSLKKLSQNPIAGGQQQQQPTDFSTPQGQAELKNLQKIALAQAQSKLIIAQIAAERGVSIAEAEIDESLNTYIENEGGRQQLAEAINYFYGWDLQDFRSVVAIQLLQQELVRTQAEQVLERVESGEDFAKLAKEFSDDGSAESGGDVGFVTKETPFVDEFKTAALKLEPGQTSGIVKTQFGFHILKATDKDPKKGIRISHVLISPSSLQTTVDERLGKAQVSNYIGVDAQAEPTAPGGDPAEAAS